MTSKTARVPRRRARRGEGERLRDDILDAAEKLLVATADADAVSIRAVADAVGVTPPSIYLHFADKDQLVFEVCRRQFRALDRWLAEALEGVTEPLERLHAMAQSYIEFGRQHPATYRVLFMHKPQQEPDTDEIMAILGESGFGRLVDEVQRCLDDGLFAGDAQLISVQLWAAAHGMTSLLISKPHFPWPDVEVMTDHFTATLFRGLAPPA